MKKKLLNFIFKIYNLLIPKIENAVFVYSDCSEAKNCTDILNYTVSNAFCVARELLNRKFEKRLIIYILSEMPWRIPEYTEISQKALQNNIELRFIPIDSTKSSLAKRLKTYFYLFKTNLWLISTGDCYVYGKLKSQKVFNMNYFISCKNDFVAGRNYRWQFLDYMLTTGLLHTTVSAAQLGVKYEACVELGFPRNDQLFKSKNKEAIFDWLKEELNYTPKKIIVYAPTYRDYEKNSSSPEQRELFGYNADWLEKYLKDNEYTLICKLHNNATKEILQYPSGVVKFKYCFDFSFYDLMSISDCVITDYSSLGYDFMLLDRPLIYNLYDCEKYAADRGMSYDPYEDFCPGTVVKTSLELKNALEELAQGIDSTAEKRHRLLRVFHKNADNKSSVRVADYLCDEFGLK